MHGRETNLAAKQVGWTNSAFYQLRNVWQGDKLFRLKQVIRTGRGLTTRPPSRQEGLAGKPARPSGREGGLTEEEK